MKEIRLLQYASSHLRKDFVRQELTLFKKHPFLNSEDRDWFVEKTETEDFDQETQEMKYKQALHPKTAQDGLKRLCWEKNGLGGG